MLTLINDVSHPNLLCKVLLVLSVFCRVRVGLVYGVGVDCVLFFFCGG